MLTGIRTAFRLQQSLESQPGTMQQQPKIVACNAKFAADGIPVFLFEADTAQELLVLFAQFAEKTLHCPPLLTGNRFMLRVTFPVDRFGNFITTVAGFPACANHLQSDIARN